MKIIVSNDRRSHKLAVRNLVGKLLAKGHSVLEVPYQRRITARKSKAASLEAMGDIFKVRAADAVIWFASCKACETQESLAFVGAALALGKRVFLIGPRLGIVTLFHPLVTHYEATHDLSRLLQDNDIR